MPRDRPTNKPTNQPTDNQGDPSIPPNFESLHQLELEKVRFKIDFKLYGIYKATENNNGIIYLKKLFYFREVK